MLGEEKGIVVSGDSRCPMISRSGSYKPGVFCFECLCRDGIHSIICSKLEK